MEKEVKQNATIEDNNAALRFLEKVLRDYEEDDEYKSLKQQFSSWCDLQSFYVTLSEKERLLNSAVSNYEEEVRANSSQGIKPLLWKDIDALKFPDNPWRVAKLVPLEGFSTIGGASGDGKTFFSHGLAKSIVTPSDFLGDPSFPVIGTNVLYIDGELSKSELQRRGRQMGFSEKCKHKLIFVSQDEINLNATDGSDMDDIINIVKKESVGVIFVDTLRAVAGGMEENKAEQVRVFFNRFKPLKDMGVSVIFLDHLRKGYENKKRSPQKDNLLASVDKVASMDNLILIEKKPGEFTMTVHQRKNRLGPEISSFDVNMKDTDINSNKNRTTLEFGGWHESIEKVMERAKASALDALEHNDMTRQDLMKHVQKDTGISKRSVHDALQSLKATQTVNVEKVGREHKFSTNKADSGGSEDKTLPV